MSSSYLSDNSSLSHFELSESSSLPSISEKLELSSLSDESYESLSINSEISQSSDRAEYNIEVLVGYRPKKVIVERPAPSWKRVRRDNKSVQALSLPVVINYNMRSLMPKIKNFCKDIDNRMVDVAFLTEVWEKLENKKHQNKLEEMLEMKGIKYISTPRPGAKRGGGAAIAVKLEKYSISKLNISIPKSIEVVWGIVKPKTVSGKINLIICCCFYSPPKTRKNPILIDHITMTLQSLLTQYPNAGVIISGDRNKMDMNLLLSIDSALKQIVNLPTRGLNILDVILTNLGSFYEEPEIIPAITPDVPNKGVPSDHSGAFVTPHCSSEPKKVTKMYKTV